MTNIVKIMTAVKPTIYIFTF